MVKHIQTIRRQIADELFEYVWPIYGIWLANFDVLACWVNLPVYHLKLGSFKERKAERTRKFSKL